MAEEKIIKKVKVGGVDYNIVASQLDPEAVVGWASISGNATSAKESTTGFMVPSDVESLIQEDIADKLTTVYKFQGSCKVAELPTDAANGDVWDIKDSGTINAGTDYEAKVQRGDNVAWVVATADGDVSHWDKLAASVSLEGYATEAWVSETAIPSALSTATSGDVGNLWTEVTSYVSAATEGLVTSADTWNETSEIVEEGAEIWTETSEEVSASASFWNTAYDNVTASASYWNTAYESVSGAAKTSDDMEIEGKLAETQAITSWVESKIEGLSGDYVEKKDIYVDEQTLVIDNEII